VHFSIIIPLHNGGVAFTDCLHSIGALLPAPDEVIIVANGTRDGSDAHARAAGGVVIALAHAVGPAHARNLGADAAQGEVLVFIDADVTVPPDLLARIAAAFATDPGIAALIGSYYNAPAAPDFWSQYKNLLHHYTHQTGNREASTFWGACGAVQRAAFVAVGGFDAAFTRPSVEDIAFGYRLKRAGYRIALVPSLQVKHHKHYTFVSLLKSDFFDRALPWTRLLLGEGRLINDLNVTFSARASVLLAGVTLIALISALLWFGGVALALGAWAGIIALNWALYVWFARVRDISFMMRAMGCHWLYRSRALARESYAASAAVDEAPYGFSRRLSVSAGCISSECKFSGNFRVEFKR